jgi:phosphatidylserine/phosphatidylglycerophosphate/cardiolipin synthase-like enzyme
MARALAAAVVLALSPASLVGASSDPAPSDGAFTVLPDDGRDLYLQAIDSATRQIKIEICVLEDPEILEHLQAALQRGVRARAIVDQGKYDALPEESANLAQYFTSAGGELHLSNPVFPRSFPKMILVDTRLAVYGSACLDQTTFLEYRDFGAVTTDRQIVRAMHRLFENDWRYTVPPGEDAPAFNPTPPSTEDDLVVAPVRATSRLVELYDGARETLDVYSEELGNPTLEGALAAAVERGVEVRLISPLVVNGATADQDELQIESLTALAEAGVEVHVSGPEQSATQPYMHARAAIADGTTGFLGSVSLSPDAATLNRELGLIVRDRDLLRQLARRFDADFRRLTRPLAAATSSSP